VFHQTARVLVQFALVVCLSSFAAKAANPKLYVQETGNFRVIYYDPSHEYLVPYLIRCAENDLKFDQKLFHYTPSQKITILLKDFSDRGNGAAGPFPVNNISVELEPPNYTYEILLTNERISDLLNHEMIHIVMGDNTSSSDRLARKIFLGKILPNAEDPESMFFSSLISPRQYCPRWFHEGIAAFMETWLSGGLGRALGGYDEMVFRAKTRDKSYIYSYVGLESEGTSVDFQIGANSYLYGTRFMTFLADHYGIDKLLAWVTRTDSTRRYFASQFARVYGKPLKEVWDEWIASEKQWQESNLALIRKYPVTKPHRLPFETLGSVSRTYYEPSTKTIYAAAEYVGHMANLAALHTDTGKIEHLTDIQGTILYSVTSLAFDAVHRRIFYASDNKNWRDLNVYDLNAHRATRLMKDTRTGDLTYNTQDQSLWGMRHNGGLSSLVRIKAPYTKLETIHTFPYGTDFFDLDLSPDGKDLTGAISNLSGEQKLVDFRLENLLKGDTSYEVLHDFAYNSPENFVHSPDGRYLYGSSFQSGVANIFRYDFQTKQLEALSNAETGLFCPLPLADGGLIALEYTAKGFVPAFVPTVPLNDVSAINYLGQDLFEKTPVLKTWKLPPPSIINTEKVITHAGSYSPLRTTRPLDIFPIVQGYKDTAAVGLRMDFADGLMLSNGDVTASYSPSAVLPMSERFHFTFTGNLWNWKVSSYYNNADFYDLFGPTKVSRKGEALKIENSKNLLFDTPRRLDLNWSVAAYSGLEALPDYQNVATPISRFVTGKVGLDYENLDESLGAIEDERGTKWQLMSNLSYAGGKGFPQIYATYDHGFLLPIHNSSVWFRGSAGKAFGDPNSPFANFFFGGFGNNWVDHGTVSRYRDYYSFPGVKLNQIGATSFSKLMAEWDLPPLRFRRVGSTVFYVNWARMSLFTSGMATDLGRASARQEFGNVGAQIDFRTVLFTYFKSTISAGYAFARDNHGKVSSEYMVSLKIL
jgi:WD40-like Beta Propeller Repeat